MTPIAELAYFRRMRKARGVQKSTQLEQCLREFWEKREAAAKHALLTSHPTVDALFTRDVLEDTYAKSFCQQDIREYTHLPEVPFSLLSTQVPSTLVFQEVAGSSFYRKVQAAEVSATTNGADRWLVETRNVTTYRLEDRLVNDEVERRLPNHWRKILAHPIDVTSCSMKRFSLPDSLRKPARMCSSSG